MIDNEKKELLNSEVLDTKDIASGTAFEFECVELFKDTIQFNRAPDELSKKILKEYNSYNSNEKEDARHGLAGDLSEEYYFPKINTVEDIRNFFIEDLSNRFGLPIKYISFAEKVPGTEKYFELEQLWVNEMKANEHNPLHKHTGVLSFVWYLDIPEEIREECYDQKSNSRSRGLIQFLSMTSNDQIRLNPRTNDVFIFNSLQRHEVYPFYSNNKRISMAGNITKIIFENGLTIEEKRNDT